ncbi:MAG: hypothetical protein L0Y45_07255 [Woeseiaceae bacterium]|nr:hypothetical protein [Woeseiaceae bacterium]
MRLECILVTGLLLVLSVVTAQSSEDETIDPASVSQQQLDQRCEDAREEKIAPPRDAEIARCKADKRNDPGYCERFFATYGDATYAANGTYVPRMINDLPECGVANEERKPGDCPGSRRRVRAPAEALVALFQHGSRGEACDGN